MPNDEAAVGSIARAARVLDALVDMPEGAALADVVARTSFSKTTAHRVLAALQDVDYVAQDPEARTYRLGARLGALARSAAAIDMAGIAYRGMRGWPKRRATPSSCPCPRVPPPSAWHAPSATIRSGR
jgi:hypothetical protein